MLDSSLLMDEVLATFSPTISVPLFVGASHEDFLFWGAVVLSSIVYGHSSYLVLVLYWLSDVSIDLGCTWTKRWGSLQFFFYLLHTIPPGMYFLYFLTIGTEF